MQSTGEQFSEESRKFLLEVKKGKSRKFVIFKEGVQIDRLVIFKAGSFDRVIRMARQDGVRGDEYWGMLQGDGTDIRFELSRSDGFANPPGTDIRLKEFLREVTGLKFEPTYVIVDNADRIDETERDDKADDSECSGTESGTVSSASSSVREENREDKFVRLLKSILPHVKRALAMKTSFSDDLKASVNEARELGRERDFEPGLAALRKLGELTKQALSESESAAATPANDLAARLKAVRHTRRQEWETRLTAIQPRFDASILSAGANVDKLQKIMRYSQNEARRQQFIKALVGLDRLERLLKDSAVATAD